jgi:hypothetical protein
MRNIHFIEKCTNPAEGDGFLRTIKARSTTSFGGEVKPSAPCSKIRGMLNNPSKYEKDTA